MRTSQQIIEQVAATKLPQLPTPAYHGSEDSFQRIALAVGSMEKHMSDEGWQIMLGLQSSGYLLCGHGMPVNTTNVRSILQRTRPGVVVVQDKREWDPNYQPLAKSQEQFTEQSSLALDSQIFRLTIIKDAHQQPVYHRRAAEEMGLHAWIVYYHPDIVRSLSPFVRPQHLIRTYHSVDATKVPDYTDDRKGCFVSGAVSRYYPLRTAIADIATSLPETIYQPHPGYINTYCHTNSYLQTLSKYKVAICTSSMYGYALRKIVEATACGCIVITDLPTDEVLPEIDDNLVRIDSCLGFNRAELRNQMTQLLKHLYQSYNPERQRYFAQRAQSWYDYRAVGKRLATDIETMRINYAAA